MAVTRLKRKERKNRARANNRQSKIKNLFVKPIIKNVDIEAIKQEFAAKAEPAVKTKPVAKAEPAVATKPVAKVEPVVKDETAAE